MEDVMLPEDDDMDIPSDDDEDDEEEIQTETGFGSVVGEGLVIVVLHGTDCLCQRQYYLDSTHNCILMHILCAVVDNLPIVPEEKFEKLSGVVKKVISQAHGIIREGPLSSFVLHLEDILA